MHVTFITDPQDFLERANTYLSKNIRSHTVIAGIAQRTPLKDIPYWFATIEENHEIKGVAMRTHPQPPHAMFAPTMPLDAAAALVRALKERGEQITMSNGDVKISQFIVSELNRKPAKVLVHTKLFFLDQVTFPPTPEGTLRQSTTDDLPLVNRWIRDFYVDSEIQGGREPDPQELAQMLDSPLTEEKVRSGNYWFWEVDGTPVHMTGTADGGFGIGRIGPVFTPTEHRGHGYAGYTVALLAQRFVDQGKQPSLYTDQANPVSNKIYERIGFIGVADEGEIVLEK